VLMIGFPALRKDDQSERAFLVALLGLGLLIASAIVAVRVVHSWEWLGYAAAILLTGLAFEAWDRYTERRDVGLGIDQDIEEKLRRRDVQLEKTFPHH